MGTILKKEILTSTNSNMSNRSLKKQNKHVDRELNAELCVYGYIQSNYKKLYYINSLITIILDYYYIHLLRFKNILGNYLITNEGLTMQRQSGGNAYTVNLFGDFLYSKDKFIYQCTLEILSGSEANFGVVLVTPSFNLWVNRRCDDAKNACVMYANAYFVIDNDHFQCDRKHKSHGAADRLDSFFRLKRTVTISINMQTKIAKIENYIIKLPDAVCIAVTSGHDNHKVTVIDQQWNKPE